MNLVRLIAVTKPVDMQDVQTSEELVAYCARVSNPTNQANHETAPRLMRYLVKHQHWSPFEMVSIVVEINTTRDIARQILRHRSFSFQEFSQRYAEMQDNLIPRELRMQDTANRQNSLEVVDELVKSRWSEMQTRLANVAQEIYREALLYGVAKEVARVVLPEGMTPSRLYMSGSLRSWIHYVRLRTGNGTQKEHRELAFECRDVLIDAFPSLTEIFDPFDPDEEI
jgi:thymidylate synthase (FAD)